MNKPHEPASATNAALLRAQAFMTPSPVPSISTELLVSADGELNRELHHFLFDPPSNPDLLKGKKIDVSSVGRAGEQGIAYVTEDRKTYGLNLIDHIKHNVSLANLGGVSRHGVIDDLRELDVANEYRGKTNIRSSSVYQKTGNLSGGNQQKVVLSKWLFANPEVLILDEPTRGIDVGAKYEIYTIIARLASEGKAIIVISSEMPELLGVSDRIYVMNEGRLVGEMAAKDASQEKIMRAIVRGEGIAS